MNNEKLKQSDVDRGRALLAQGWLQQLHFSAGAYQADIQDPQSGAVSPLMKVSDEGMIDEAFCDCSEDVREKLCDHLCCLYYRVMLGTRKPLHIRFRDSFWNQLCLMVSQKIGYDEKDLQHRQGQYEGYSSTGKLLFSIKALSVKGKKKLEDLISNRQIETEETSLKFFNVSSEEIAFWRQGRPSSQLQFELCYLSDIAKWLLILCEDGASYQLSFKAKKDQLPHWVTATFEDVTIGFYISEASWPNLVVSLDTVQSPLKIMQFVDEAIVSISFDPKLKQFSVERKQGACVDKSKAESGIDIPGWKYIYGKGFLPRSKHSLFSDEIVVEDKIARYLSTYRAIFRQYLVQEIVHEGVFSLGYHLAFNADKSLVITPFFKENGDLDHPHVSFFGPWLYIPKQGFYEIHNPLFLQGVTIIPYEGVSGFVSAHRIFLSSIEGFATHVLTLESEVSYFLDNDLSLCFTSHYELTEEKEGVIDFGTWVFLPQRGFFQKQTHKSPLALFSGSCIPQGQIPIFIKKHFYDLGSIAGFFTSSCPVVSVLVDVFLTEDMLIKIRPYYEYRQGIDPRIVHVFEEFAYVQRQGFSQIPFPLPLIPYTAERVISQREELSFLCGEYCRLQPFLHLVDPRLKKGDKLVLKVEELKKKGEGDWLAKLFYENDLGSVSAYAIWKGLEAQERFLFTDAGLVDVKDSRFSWLKSVSKRHWNKAASHIALSGIEWMRLNAFEEMEVAKHAEQHDSINALLISYKHMRGDQPLYMAGLKSTLRPYQEVGLQWLWFLYCNGLSGLLCDEMGLGKTHQAMALLAATSGQMLGKKYLVACPTSVIYHWEDLLKKFLPELKVMVFYGANRDLSLLESRCDLLLTSYGMLRSERKALSTLQFDLAVFDEIQYAKNPRSLLHKAIRSIKAKMVLGLTGTPLENHLIDLKALFDIVLPGYLPSEAQFKEFFMHPIEKGMDEDKKRLLSKIIKPFVLRRKKAEVLLELPEKTEQIAYCDLLDQQKDLYAQIFNEQKEGMLRELTGEGGAGGYVHVFSILSRLKQICNHPALYYKDKENYHAYPSGKWEIFTERVQEARESGYKIVVFTQYLDMMDIIIAYLEKHQIGYAQIRGSTRHRREEIERFQKDPYCEVFVASLQAAGSGIELTAASVVIHYDRWWNPARESQATDRVHRLGQTRGVQVFKLVTRKTIEERIHELIESKKNLLTDVVGFDAQEQLKTLSKQELVELIQLIDRDIKQNF